MIMRLMIEIPQVSIGRDVDTMKNLGLARGGLKLLARSPPDIVGDTPRPAS